METDKLIALVRNECNIWDKSHMDYANNNARARSWMSVVEGMCDGFEELKEIEKKKKMADVKDKWRHIRDNYVRYVNGGGTGDAGSRRRKYIYADALEFLRNSVEKRSSTAGNFDEDEWTYSVIVPPELENSQDIKQEANPEEGEPLIPRPYRTTPAPSASFHQPPSKKRRRPVTTTPFQDDLQHKIEAPIIIRSEAEDPDRAYLFSLLPNYKKLNDEDKLDFQGTVLTFLRSRLRRTPANPPPDLNLHLDFSSGFRYQYSPEGQHNCNSLASRSPSASSGD